MIKKKRKNIENSRQMSESFQQTCLRQCGFDFTIKPPTPDV